MNSKNKWLNSILKKWSRQKGREKGSVDKSERVNEKKFIN